MQHGSYRAVIVEKGTICSAKHLWGLSGEARPCPSLPSYVHLWSVGLERCIVYATAFLKS